MTQIERHQFTVVCSPSIAVSVCVSVSRTAQSITPFTRYNRLSNGFDNRFDNRLYRVNEA